MRLAAAAVLLAGGCDEGIDPPVIDLVAPAIASRGRDVDIHGAGLCPEGDLDPCASFAGSVAFGVEIPQIRAQVRSWAPASIRAVVPDTIADGPTEIVVTVDGRSSNAVAFTVAP